MNSTRTNGIADHSLGHDSETISSERRRELPPDPDATLGKSHDREFIGNCGDHGSTKTQSTSTVNYSKRLDKSKSTLEGEEKPIVKPSSVQKARSSDGSGKTEVKAHPDGWRETVPSTCSCQGKRTVAKRRASGMPNHQSWRVSGPKVTAFAISRCQVEVIGVVRWCQ